MAESSQQLPMEDHRLIQTRLSDAAIRRSPGATSHCELAERLVPGLWERDLIHSALESTRLWPFCSSLVCNPPTKNPQI
jgi:hypothetical protein